MTIDFVFSSCQTASGNFTCPTSQLAESGRPSSRSSTPSRYSIPESDSPYVLTLLFKILHFILKFEKWSLLFHKNWWEFQFLITRRTLFENSSYILPTKLTLILQAVIVPIHFGPFKGTWQALIIGHHDVSSPPLSIHKRKEWLAGSGASDRAKNLEFPKHDETEGPQRRLFQTEGQSPEHSHKGVQVQ